METRRFESRELKPYVEHYPSSDLKVGEVYFRVQYQDNELLLPEMDILVFIGRDLRTTDAGLLYFQDYESYAAGTRFDDPRGEAVFERFYEKQSSGVFDYERALNELLRCSLRRQDAGTSQS